VTPRKPAVPAEQEALPEPVAPREPAVPAAGRARAWHAELAWLPGLGVRGDVLIEAAGRLRNSAQLAIAGAGPLGGKLRRQAARLGLAGRVTFLGHIPDPDLPALYRAADVFAIASEAELQSLATMEAMASGLPVVAADACALGELIRPDINGCLFTPGDAADLAARLDLLTADSGLRHRMGAESLRIIAGHERESTLETWAAVYGLMAGMSRSAMPMPSASPASPEAV